MMKILTNVDGIHFQRRGGTPKLGLRHLWTCVLAAAGLACAAASIPAVAQPYPNQTIKFIVPYSPGGGTDVTTRALTERMGPALGQTIIVDYKPGGSGNIGAVALTNSMPNGYTILVGSSTYASNSIIPGANPPFDLMKDFEFIGKIGGIDLVVMAPTKLGVDSLQGLIDYIRKNPGKTQYGSAGVGTSGHLGGELLMQVAKVKSLHVPYKGESAAYSDLLGGQITFLLCTPSICEPKVRDGTLKALATTGKHRSGLFPDVPTATELGYPVIAGPWWFLAAPKGTPEAIVNKLNTVLNEVQSSAAHKAKLAKIGVEVDATTSPAAVRADLQAEIDRWTPIVKSAGVKY
jgi:tripartite-type tricarboxylate transporter receptor subunit TctC